MSVKLAIVANPAAGGIAGLDGEFGWGRADTVAESRPAEGAASVTIALGDVSSPGPLDVRWLSEIPADPPPGRTVAPGGDGLWSRALWPVRDELFDLAGPETPAGVLIVSGDAAHRADVAHRLAERGVPAEQAGALTAEGLARAGTVAFLPDEVGRNSMPAAAPAVLAARRLLIAPRCTPTFGLLPGTDYLSASTEDDVVQYAHALFRYPRSFDTFAAFGRLAAERSRASTIYGRLVEELLAEGRG